MSSTLPSEQAMPGTPLPSIASLELTLPVSTTPRGVFNAMLADLKTPVGGAECTTYDLESLFSPFAHAAAEGEIDLDKVITPAAFYQMADSLSIEDMFAAVREANLQAATNTVTGSFGVPDVDMNMVEDALASVPSSIVEDMEEACVPTVTTARRRSARPSRTPLSRVATAAVSADTGSKVTATRKSRPKRVTDAKRRRAPKVAVAEDLKDEKYWARREKNNAAARRNRAMKKAQKAAEQSKLPRLNQKNMELVDEVLMLRQELKGLREALRQRLIREGLADMAEA